MNSLGGYLDDAYITWLAPVMNCCGSLRKQQQQYEPTRGIEKSTAISYDQPHLIPPPVIEPPKVPMSRSREWVSRASARGNFTVKRTFNAYNGPRRPRIGHPSNFRHIANALPSKREGSGFRPLELSIYQPHNQLSPILPHFTPEQPPTLANNPSDSTCPSETATHSRSDSALSFRIPRKPLRSNSEESSDQGSQHQPQSASVNPQELVAALEKQLPQIPPAARLRSMTEPPVYRRVKTALQEKSEIEQRLKKIDTILEERRSVYLSSRAASVFEEPGSTSIPLPLAPAQSESFFVEHASASPLSQSERPKTAPSKIVHAPDHSDTFAGASSSLRAIRRTQIEELEKSLPPPPLPLVLQQPHPPLRKKKSFSRISHWLRGNGASDSDLSRYISTDVVTNTPKNITAREGFYQCVDFSNYSSGSGSHRRMTTTSISTISTLPESDLDEPTLPTSWSPQSTPSRGSNRNLRATDEVNSVTIVGRDSEERTSVELIRTRTFGQKETEAWRVGQMPSFAPERGDVGVAF
ncbi:hypothetical protein F5884DRAFT_797970 [Xylogone sp. PMI_703]|nr:hypothetical protein F5884DRAFT_797970 [Xylogone sp. PMI_703]